MTPEGELEYYLVSRVKASGGDTRKLRWIGRNGAPDRFIWWPGPTMAFVEVKHKTSVTVAQKQEHQTLRGAGFRVAVVRSKDEIDDLLSELHP